MKTSECAHCGKVGFTINDACLNCSLTINPCEPATANATSETNPQPPQNENILEPPTPDFLQSVAPTPEADETDQSVPNSSDANYQPETGRLRYLRVECWKCKIVYNWEKTKICAQCGCALRFYKKEDIRSLKGDSVLSSHLARSFLIVVFILATLVGGFYYVVKNMEDAKNKAAAGIAEEQIELPADGWHKSNLRNFYRELPTVDEILAKNNRATSKAAPSSTNFQTLALKGSISFADGDCVTDLCADKIAEAAMREDQIEMSRVNGYQPRVFTKDQFKSKITDDYDLPEYQAAGVLEAYRKAPDKVLRKMSVGVPRQTRKLETIEAFDGFTGWKKSLVSENRQTLSESVSILAGLELEALKNSVSALKNDYSSKTMKFARLKKVKNSVNFVLENLSFDKSELIYFDAVSGLITKIESGDNTCYLMSYAEYGDVKLPSVMYFRTIAEDGYVVWMKVENIAWTINESLDDAMFAKP
jgi:hypothetical protein